MDLRQYRDAQRALWAAGDYRRVGRMLEPAARTLVDRAGIVAGQRVLDVATGSGSVAVAAAQAGADVVGVDITDAWFDEARRRADAAGVRFALMVGDAEELPVDDASFDLVASSFGAIFAPRHEVVAAELARVCRRGGTIALNSWTPDSAGEALVTALTTHLPAPAAFSTPSVRWGEPPHVTALFATHGVEVAFEHHQLDLAFRSAAAFETFLFESSGGFICARRALDDLRRWEQALDDVRSAIEDMNEADDGSFRARWRFLTAVGTKHTSGRAAGAPTPFQ